MSLSLILIFFVFQINMLFLPSITVLSEWKLQDSLAKESAMQEYVPTCQGDSKWCCHFALHTYTPCSQALLTLTVAGSCSRCWTLRYSRSWRSMSVYTSEVDVKEENMQCLIRLWSNNWLGAVDKGDAWEELQGWEAVARERVYG